jgi:tetratricopeptide (TPR) repeat protein
MKDLARYSSVNERAQALAVFLLTLAALLFLVQAGQAQTPPSKRAEKLSQDARTEFYNKNYKKALEYSDKAIKIYPQFAYAYYLKGWSEFRLNMLQPALASLNKAVELGHDQTEVNEPRGEVYYFLKNYDGAEKDLLAFTASPKGNGETNFILARTYFDQQKYQQALPYFQKAAEMNYPNKDIQYFISVCQGVMKDTAAQEKAAMQAVQNESQFKGEAYYQAGMSLLEQKKYDDAIAAYDKAIQFKPSIGEAYLGLYKIYRILNRDEDAAAIMKKLIQQDPQNLQGYLNLSWISSLSDQPKDAVEAARQATKIKPDESTGFTNMCRAYNDLKLYDSAVQACNDALKIKPGDGETFYYLGRAKDAQKKSNEATLYFDKAVQGLTEYTRLNPENADGYYLLGNAYYATLQRTKAITAYLKALELMPRYVKAYFNLGYIYAQLGDYKSAREQYDKLVLLNSELAARLLPSIEKPK